MRHYLLSSYSSTFLIIFGGKLTILQMLLLTFIQQKFILNQQYQKSYTDYSCMVIEKLINKLLPKVVFLGGLNTPLL